MLKEDQLEFNGVFTPVRQIIFVQGALVLTDKLINGTLLRLCDAKRSSVILCGKLILLARHIVTCAQNDYLLRACSLQRTVSLPVARSSGSDIYVR